MGGCLRAAAQMGTFGCGIYPSQHLLARCGSWRDIAIGCRGWLSPPNGLQLASAGFDGTVQLWDTIYGTCLQTISEHSAPVLRVVWSPDGRTLASCNFDHSIFLWDVTGVRSQTILYGHT